MKSALSEISTNHKFKMENDSIYMRITTISHKLKEISFIPKEEYTQTKSVKSPLHCRIFDCLENYFIGNVVENNIYYWRELELDKYFQKTFTRDVYLYVSHILFGETRTYGDCAEALQSRAYQAIGSILKRNPFPILIPCHRIIGKDGLGGFMGEKSSSHWKLHLKKKLLKFEAKIAGNALSFLL